MKIYLVKQTQPNCEYVNTTIYALSDKDKAIEYTRKLNEEYGNNCVFTEDYDFITVHTEVDFEEVHYYTWEEIELDEPLIE